MSEGAKCRGRVDVYVGSLLSNYTQNTKMSRTWIVRKNSSYWIYCNCKYYLQYSMVLYLNGIPTFNIDLLLHFTQSERYFLPSIAPHQDFTICVNSSLFFSIYGTLKWFKVPYKRNHCLNNSGCYRAGPVSPTSVTTYALFFTKHSTHFPGLIY